MADAATQRRDELQSAYRRYLGTDAPQPALDEFATSNVSLEDRVRQLLSSPEFTAQAQERARLQFQPSFSQLDIAESEAQRRGDELLQLLEERKKELPEEVLGQFSRRGLLRSGVAVKGLTGALTGLERERVSAQRERAARLSDLAARRAALTLQQQDVTNQLLEQPRQAFEEGIAQSARDAVAARKVVSAGGRQLLIDTRTGEVVADLGASSTGRGRGGSSATDDTSGGTTLRDIVQQYKDAGYTRADIESAFENDDAFGDGIPEGALLALDELFPEEQVAAPEAASTSGGGSSPFGGALDFLNRFRGFQQDRSDTIQKLFGLR